jgi:hypothetical protein
VETGTYRGTTTALLGATCLPVYTTEISPHFFGYAGMRFLFNRSNIHRYREDSRSFLRRLGADPDFPRDDVFFYLDAHWGEDLPLREELEIIFSTWARPVVMVDDFKVPGMNYIYDDYGPGKVLDVDYIAPVASKIKVEMFFPSVDSLHETGLKRGCVVLCAQESAAIIEQQVKTLRGFRLDESPESVA